MPFWWQVVPVMMTGKGEQPTLRISTTEKKEDLRLLFPNI